MGSGRELPCAAVGFYAVAVCEPHGLLGGLLLLNRNGRPLEFHCTAPVKPNRAQEILYGATLEPYLYGEAIGRALLSKATVTPEFVCVDSPAALALRDVCDVPTAWILPPEEPGTGSEPLFRVDAGHPLMRRPTTFGRHRGAVHRGYAADEERLLAQIGGLPEHFNLSEPFERIRAAIDEAQRGVR